jgi:hypothetical protein
VTDSDSIAHSKIEDESSASLSVLQLQASAAADNGPAVKENDGGDDEGSVAGSLWILL